MGLLSDRNRPGVHHASYHRRFLRLFDLPRTSFRYCRVNLPGPIGRDDGPLHRWPQVRLGGPRPRPHDLADMQHPARPRSHQSSAAPLRAVVLRRCRALPPSSSLSRRVLRSAVQKGGWGFPHPGKSPPIFSSSSVLNLPLSLPSFSDTRGVGAPGAKHAVDDGCALPPARYLGYRSWWR